ncbi:MULTISPECIES: glutamate--tRNA ligase [unclassified Nitratiruptor]|uniref:glutamate--tRNA ligase n=1 Tax=unclassified Nitratiruptor TaxID=2624044 RepID=UPI0019168576|nr:MULTISPECIES: glutamate--tRNA ligase [unclassified Nitratiruptor]BCD60479.1 glutamyl-tRNA synthetase [Nitratiruptor sp. YY08-10]BCD64032.1 glutamyl-tRNA synthetase [Nitratiruptor sp. YY08-14]
MIRFAPSPTGDMHIGNLRVAIFNYIEAKKRNERFLIRIEDTDIERNIEGKDKEILEILNTFGLHYDDVVYQSKNFSFHQNFAYKLLNEGKAFACFCTPEELEKEREEAKKEKRAYRYSGKCENITLDEASQRGEPFVVRIKKPAQPIEFDDIIKGHITFAPNEVDSFVILRADARPTYNFACAIDDMLYDITLVIRGEDHVSNTPKQIHIRNALGYDKKIEYAHLPIILNEDGKKMSKRDKASSVKWLLEEGFLPEAIANYLILLGNKTPKEIFTVQEAIEWFDLKNISKAPAKFDIEKLRFINRMHLQMKNERELAQILGIDEEFGALAKLYLEEASTLKELKSKIDLIFNAKRENEAFHEEIETLRSLLSSMELPESFDEFKKELMQKSGLKGKKFFKPLRILLTGAEHGPELSELYPAIKNHIKEVIQ